jgi:hypothetical protein
MWCSPLVCLRRLRDVTRTKKSQIAIDAARRDALLQAAGLRLDASMLLSNFECRSSSNYGFIAQTY